MTWICALGQCPRSILKSSIAIKIALTIAAHRAGKVIFRCLFRHLNAQRRPWERDCVHLPDVTSPDLVHGFANQFGGRVQNVGIHFIGFSSTFPLLYGYHCCTPSPFTSNSAWQNAPHHTPQRMICPVCHVIDDPRAANFAQRGKHSRWRTHNLLQRERLDVSVSGRLPVTSASSFITKKRGRSWAGMAKAGVSESVWVCNANSGCGWGCHRFAFRADSVKQHFFSDCECLWLTKCFFLCYCSQDHGVFHHFLLLPRGVFRRHVSGFHEYRPTPRRRSKVNAIFSWKTR